MAVVGLARTRRPQGGKQSRVPWPILRPEDCAHLDMHELLVRGDDGKVYKAAVCALCGAVQDVQSLRHRNGPPRTMLMSKAAGDSIDWRGNPLYRWITIHPQGKEEQGYPVLLRLDKEGSSSGHIVGGAGGALNYRRISRLKTKRQYQVEARARREEKKGEREAREAAMSEAELGERAAARTEVAQARTEATHEYLKTVAEVQGWGPVALSDEDKTRMSEDSVRRIEAARERWQERAARELDEKIKDLVIGQHDREIAEALDGTNPEELMSDEVDDSGLGYAALLANLAEAHGMGPDAARLRARFTTTRAFEAAEEGGYIEDAQKARDYVDMLQVGAAEARTEDKPFREEGLHRPEFSSEVADPAQARRLLVAREQWKQHERELKAKERGIEALAPGSIEIPAGAALVETTELSDEQAMKRVTMGLQDRARLVAADELLSEVEAVEERTGSIEQHIHEGHTRQLEEIGQATFHQPVGMGRETVDVLGPDASAAIFSELLKEEMNGDTEAAREALREHHIRTQAQKAKDAVAEGKQRLAAAEDAVKDLPELGDDGVQSLLAIEAANDKRREELEEAKRVVGVALGRLEMLGSMNAALGEEHERIDVALGELGGKQAYQIAAALGLEEGEYEVQSDGPHKYLLLEEKGWRKLIEPPDPEQGELYEAAIGIKKGEADQEGWLPDGIMGRPSDAYYDDVAIQRAYEWDATPEFKGKTGEELGGAIRDYAGNMLANDGAGSVGSLRFRMLSPEFQADHLDDAQVGEYQRAMMGLFPASGADDDWESLAQELVAPIREREDPEHAALDSQRISVPQSYDAMHRALNEVPGGKVAFKPLAHFGVEDAALLRDYFWEHLTEEKRPVAAETRERRAATTAEGEKVIAGQATIFGEVEPVTRGKTEAFQERVAAEEVAGAENAWTRYVKAQGSPQAAYHSLQDLVKGELVEKFATQYGRETGREVKGGRADIANPLKHIIGLMPKETLERVLDADNATLRKMYDGLRRRDAEGRYAPGEVSDLAQRILAKARKMQLTLFAERPPSTQHFTIGKTAEAQARRVWSQVAATFDPDHPVEIPQDVSMSGDYVHQQRAIRMLERVKRFGLHYSTGSGKSLIGIGGFTDLAAQGKVKRGLFIVPPKIVAQFGGEMNRFVEPGKFRYFADPSASADERRQMYADPEAQMVAVSHQAWREDVTWAVAQSKFGGDTNEASHFLLTGPADERQDAVNKALEEQGWQYGFAMCDEAHDALNRKGKPNSRLANVTDATTSGAEYFITATATQVKNDASELYDALCKVRPDKFKPEGWEQFHRRYGLDTRASRDALQRLVMPYFYAKDVDTGVKRTKVQRPIALSDWQKAEYGKALDAYQRARRAAEGSREGRDALAELVGPKGLEGLDEAAKVRKLGDAGKALGFTRDRAIERVVMHAPAEHNPRIQDVIELAQSKRDADDDGGQVPGLVFTQSLESVDLLREALEGKGFRVGTITGGKNGEESENVRAGFNADQHRNITELSEQAAARRKAAKYDILVCSEAGSAGLNMERGRWMYHYDQPWTAKTLQQREGREDRLTQRWGGIEIHTAKTATPFEERRHQIVRDKADLMNTFMEDTENIDDTGLAADIRNARSEALSGAMMGVAAG